MATWAVAAAAAALAALAARATRRRRVSTTLSASSGDERSRCLLLELSHDELGMIVEGLADPLQPIVAVALSSSCKGLRTPLREICEVLHERHKKVKKLCRKMGMSCADCRDAKRLDCPNNLTIDNTTTLAMLLTNWLPRLQELKFSVVGDAPMQELFDNLGRGAAPSLICLSLNCIQFGPAGAEALAGALRRGALRKVAMLDLSDNHVGNDGVAALASSARKLPALQWLVLGRCEIGDDGVASLVDDLCKDDFKALTKLYIYGNDITEVSRSRVVAAIEAGGLPLLEVCNGLGTAPYVALDVRERLRAGRTSPPPALSPEVHAYFNNLHGMPSV